MISVIVIVSVNSVFYYMVVCSQVVVLVLVIIGVIVFGSVWGCVLEIYCVKLVIRVFCFMYNNGCMFGVIGGSGFYIFFGLDICIVNLDIFYG